MNEMPEKEFTDEFLVCVAEDGRFLKQEEDGYATWLSWTDNVLLADRFGEYFTYGERTVRTYLDPLPDPSWFKKWPEVPSGCRMMRCKVNVTVWLRG